MINWSPNFGELHPLWMPEAIKRTITHTLWRPTSEALPPEPPEGLHDILDLDEYIVMIDGAEKPTVLTYAGSGEWYRDGVWYSVTAWMPLPEPWRGEE